MKSIIAVYASMSIEPWTNISSNVSDEVCKLHYDHTEMLLHLQDQYREAYKRYVQELAQRDRPQR